MKPVSLAALAALALVMARPAEAAGLEVSGVWAWPSRMIEQSLGVFMTLRNPGAEADRLVGARSPLSPHVSLHDHGKNDHMTALEAIDIPAGGSVTLEPGRLHVMVMDVAPMPMAGSSFPLTLRFEKAGERAVTVEVKTAPVMMGGGMMGR